MTNELVAVNFDIFFDLVMLLRGTTGGDGARSDHGSDKVVVTFIRFDILYTVMSQNNEHFLFGDFPENVRYFGTASLEIFQKVFVILGQKSVPYFGTK